MKPNPLSPTLALAWTLMGVIIVLLVGESLLNRSLWLDEAMLALNIIEKKPLALLKPLDYSQAAPVLFVLIEKCFVLVFGDNDFAFRIFPLICGLASVPLFFGFSSGLTGNRVIPALALCLLACSRDFIYYSSEVKQYETDVFVLCAIYFTAFSESSFVVRHRKVLLSITGAVAVFLSNISVVALAIVGLLLVYRCLRNKADRSMYLVPILVWAGCEIINFFLFIYNNPNGPGMRAYWHDFFMPFPWQAGFKDWLVTRISDIFSSMLPTPAVIWHFPKLPTPPVLSMALYAMGLIDFIVSKRFRLLYLCTGPVILHLLLSSFQLYPFYTRLTLYLLPLFLVVMANGLYALCRVFLRLRYPYLPYVAAAFVLLCFVWRAFVGYPFKSNEEIKPVLLTMNQHIKDNYNVYVYFGAWAAFRYYKETGLVRFGKANIVVGQPHLSDYNGYLTEMDSLKGPTWFLIAHGATHEEEQHILDGMAARGPLLRKVIGWGSHAYLFNLKK
jgi:hypothetical protein